MESPLPGNLGNPPTMKPSLLRIGVRLAIILVMTAGSGVAQAADDIENLFQMGRTAYYKGDLEQAHQLLGMVEQQAPRHQETRILLGQIRAKLRTFGTSLKKKYEGVKLGKIEFTEVTFEEALEGLRVLSKNASSGQVIPNFIITDPTLKPKSISLMLTDVPLTQAMEYLARIAGARISYDNHAAIFSNAAG
ncbi:MAG: hypothetical protein RL015_3310 [Verrucomicrobiota bacterium]|jgi:hypothetical protein